MERKWPTNQDIEYYSRRPHVYLFAIIFSVAELWRDISRRPTKLSFVYLLIGADDLGQPEICDFDLINLIFSVFHYQNIFCFQVSMDYATALQVVYNIYYLVHY